MGESTQIAWTDHTYNPWWGCTKVSPGCDHCYAETFDKRVGGSHWGKGAPRREFKDAHWKDPLKWNREAAEQGVQRRVFCASMADVMDDEAPAGARERLWDLIDATPNLTWQLLTKRPNRYSRYLPSRDFKHNNVWLGTTAEDQKFYNARWPFLHAAAAARGLVSFVSYEPAIGPLSIKGRSTVPDWLIFGGESGSGRRPMQQKWAEDLLEECRSTGTRFFMKQFSAQTPKRGSELVPIELLVREFPEARNGSV